ncbi:MAG TPA: serine hydrolase [Bacteroidales bacterium]|nr:serine hydrolase [Bacteroidales bacterium]
MKKCNCIFRSIFLTLFLLAACLYAASQPITSDKIDILVERTMETFDVPGIAVAVIKDDEVIHSKGYGVRSLKTKQKVDSNTLFGIASISKAFTTAALGMLVDEKKLDWNDRVIDFIPEFRLYDPYVTSEFTIADLLTHRSGMGLGAGDLMIWPGRNDFKINDIIHNLRYLKPVSSFRTKYDYDNLLYIVAGEVVARVSGMSWDDFIEKRIMLPLGMTGSAASYSRLNDKSNVIDPHAPVNGKVKVIDRNFNEVANAAAGIYSNITDISKWIIMQMNKGRYGEGLNKQLFSEAVHRTMWSPHTIIPVRESPEFKTHFSAYGLGWRLNDIMGYKQVGHTGGLGGIVTQVTLIPELKLGIIVFTNQQSGAAFRAISTTILDSYFGITGADRVKQYSEAGKKDFEDAKKITDEIWKSVEAKKSELVTMDKTIYTGTYTDSWFGDVTISDKNGKLWFDSKRSPDLSGEMFYFRGNTFIVKWNDRSMDADAYVMFCLDGTGKASGMTMKAISPLTDFSYDFHDLDFTR